MVEISIIVCVYNGEKWIKNCLEKMLNQTVKNKEIIVIDDGSEDLTPQIIDTFVQNHKEFRLLRRENRGRCISRLDGMRMAQGRYIGFVDVDDDYEIDMYEKMLNASKIKDYDIVECKYDIFGCNSDGKQDAEKRLKKYYQVMPKHLYGDEIIDNYLRFVAHEPIWLRIYKKKIVKRVYYNMIHMLDVKSKFMHRKCDIMEDMFLTPAFFLEAKSYCMIDDVTYHYYYMQPGSSKKDIDNDFKEYIYYRESLLEAALFVKEYYSWKYADEKNEIKKKIINYINVRLKQVYNLSISKKYTSDIFCEFANCRIFIICALHELLNNREKLENKSLQFFLRIWHIMMWWFITKCRSRKIGQGN